MLRFSLGIFVLFSWGCSGTIETTSGSDSSLSLEAPSTDSAGPTLSATPLPQEDQLGGFCGDAGVGVGLARSPGSALMGVSLYQSVEIPLSESQAVSGASRAPKVEVVAGRDSLVRVFVDPEEGRPSAARLTLGNRTGESWIFEEWATLPLRSEKASLGSTFNFHLEGKYITSQTELSVELFELVNCENHVPAPEAARFPQQGALSLAAREVGPLQLVIVPIRFWGDDSGRMPDVSAEHLSELRAHLGAIFPVPSVELRLHEVVDTHLGTLEEILGQVMQLRASENPAAQVGYFGLVNPSETMVEYCGGSCVAGVSAVGSASGHSSSGVAVGFREATAETFVHELGHMHRLEHAPCGEPSGADRDYPHADARLGAWGYDHRTRQLIDPAGEARDFMSYCDPAWISDFNTQNLIERIALSNSLPRADIVSWQPNLPADSSPAR